MNIATIDISVILPAAGTGERMRLVTPKQFIHVSRRPLIYHTISGFFKFNWIRRIVVVIAPGSEEFMAQTLNFILPEYRQKILVIQSKGSSRHESIYSGLKVLQTWGHKSDLVIIHDAVRPFVEEKLLSDVVLAAVKYGASGIMVPLTSTVIAANSHNKLDHVLDRNMFKASEMPQAFQFSVILDAYSKCSIYDLKYGTECLHIVQKYNNVRAKLVLGSSLCWKVTYRRDLPSALSLLKENESVNLVCSSIENMDVICDVLKKCLLKSFKKVEGPSIIPNHGVNNFVVIHPQASIVNVITEDSVIPISSWKPTTIVNVTFDGNAHLNIQKLIKKSRERSKTWKEHLIYHVISKNVENSEILIETGELVTSLLFHSNESLSGQIFLM